MAGLSPSTLVLIPGYRPNSQVDGIRIGKVDWQSHRWDVIHFLEYQRYREMCHGVCIFSVYSILDLYCHTSGETVFCEQMARFYPLYSPNIRLRTQRRSEREILNPECTGWTWRRPITKFPVQTRNLHKSRILSIY